MVAGHCLVPFDLFSFGLGGLPSTMLLGCWPLPGPFGTLQAQASHLVRGVFQLHCSLKLNFFFVLAAGCTLNPGCQDLGLFCRSSLRSTLSSSDQASVPSDALVKPRLDFLLMSRMWALGSGLFGCSVFRFRHESNSKFVTNPSGTTPRGRKPVTACSRRFLVWLVGGGVFGSWDRCVWLCRGFRWTLVQRRGGPPLTMLGGAFFGRQQKKRYKYTAVCIYI